MFCSFRCGLLWEMYIIPSKFTSCPCRLTPYILPLGFLSPVGLFQLLLWYIYNSRFLRTFSLTQPYMSFPCPSYVNGLWSVTIADFLPQMYGLNSLHAQTISLSIVEWIVSGVINTRLVYSISGSLPNVPWLRTLLILFELESQVTNYFSRPEYWSNGLLHKISFSTWKAGSCFSPQT
jgi:hypothetical protein